MTQYEYRRILYLNNKQERLKQMKDYYTKNKHFILERQRKKRLLTKKGANTEC